MSKRTIILVVLLCVAVALSGCELLRLAAPATPVPTKAAATPVPPTVAPTKAAAVAPTVTPVPAPPPVAAVVVQPSATLAGPQGPELLYPPDGTSDTVIDLIWKWGRALGADEWFELQIWPDVPNPKPEVYAWLQEGRQRVTAATFMPGKYFWRVIVVKGKEEKRSAELSPFSLTWSFIITRPSTKGGLTPTCVGPCPTETPSPTPTRTPWWWWQTPVVRTRTPTRVPTRTSTATALPQPTPTGTLLPVTPTNTSMPPTPTNTAYPQPTVPQPTATNTAYPQPTVPVPTWTPRPGLTRTATPVVTVYPPPYSSPTPQPGVTQTAYPYPPSLRR